MRVVEVNRTGRQHRRRHGKHASGEPKGADGAAESLRALRVARRSAVKARTQAANQLHALVSTATDELKEGLKYWRLDEVADYGPLDGLARNRLRADLIAEHWDDILRVAGSLLTRTVRASDILRVLQANGGRPRSLGKALA